MSAVSKAILSRYTSFFPSKSEWEREAAIYRAIEVICKKIDLVATSLFKARELLENPANLVIFKSVTHLDLSNCGLELLPDELFNLRGLKTLNLAQNKLGDLSPGIRDLADLEVLQLERNPLESSQIHEIACILLELPSLKQFSSDCQSLIEMYHEERIQSRAICRAWEQIQPELVSCRDLVYIIRKVPQLEYLFKLATPHSREISRTLNLCKLYFHLSFDRIRKLSLERLNLQFFPPALCCLRELRELDLSHNLFDKVPREIEAFGKLETLSLVDNPLPTRQLGSIEKKLKAAMPSLKEVSLPTVRDQTRSSACIIM